MSFLTVLEQDATEVEQSLVNGAKDFANYIDNVLVTELIPELETALMTALKNFTQQEIAVAITAIKSAVG